VFQKNERPFCFCYNFVSRDQILLILQFGNQGNLQSTIAY